MGGSLCVAVLFALHPLNVESVAWVAECKKNVLPLERIQGWNQPSTPSPSNRQEGQEEGKTTYSRPFASQQRTLLRAGVALPASFGRNSHSWLSASPAPYSQLLPSEPSRSRPCNSFDLVSAWKTPSTPTPCICGKRSVPRALRFIIPIPATPSPPGRLELLPHCFSPV